jgi:hypothetical protein
MGVSSTERVQADRASPGRRDGEPQSAQLRGPSLLSSASAAC